MFLLFSSLLAPLSRARFHLFLRHNGPLCILYRDRLARGFYDFCCTAREIKRCVLPSFHGPVSRSKLSPPKGKLLTGGNPDNTTSLDPANLSNTTSVDPTNPGNTTVVNANDMGNNTGGANTTAPLCDSGMYLKDVSGPTLRLIFALVVLPSYQV